MSRPVRDILDDTLCQTSDADRFLEIIRAAGFDVVLQATQSALRVDLEERDDLTAKLFLENERLVRGNRQDRRPRGRQSQCLSGDNLIHLNRL